MKAIFKPLGLAAAVAAVTAGYTGVAGAQTAPSVASNSLGDLAIVPYYTTAIGFVTGVHIINTSGQTQVVKLRLRRGTDSMDALDFNLILSPFDEWTGWLDDDEDVSVGPLASDTSTISFKTTDNSCTVPAFIGQQGFIDMPVTYRPGAGTGYIEVLGMGSAPVSSPIGVASKHINGVPVDCDLAADNFFQNNSIPGFGGVANPALIGVLSSTQTNQRFGAGSVATTTYGPTGNVLKVSYFVRDAASGIEFGNDAVHIADFGASPSMTNQEFGLFSGDLQGFDFPDLNGAAPANGGLRGLYDGLRTALGGSSVINDWSANAANNVGTDWVITVPGQYTMMNLYKYLFTQIPEDHPLHDPLFTCTALNDCDHRDIPLRAGFIAWDREERGIADIPGELVPSPSIPGQIPTTVLEYEVNVVEWGVEPVLRADNPVTIGVPDGAVYGWAELLVSPFGNRTQAVCEFVADPNNPTLVDITNPVDCNNPVTTKAPLVGFVAWQRSFADNPSRNYGRAVEHSYGSVPSN
ncbi:MAG: hypothetical protein DRQ97_02290 [Gammaproteobacteria bacterium]|nr:MAG: hypothetical protein DRQ97_02290 [Gammaproteobacteria bacterium]